jgi:hypothetical protein
MGETILAACPASHFDDRQDGRALEQDTDVLVDVEQVRAQSIDRILTG